MAPHEQLVQNQQTFRSANERFQSLAVAIVPAGGLVPFLCECADDACLGRVEMTVRDYDEVHLDRDRYVVLHDHRMVTGEDVVERRDGFDIVRKSEASA